MQFDYHNFLQLFLNLPERQGKGEQIACKFLLNWLEREDISYQLQKFSTQIPVIKSAALTVDGVQIPCAGCSFVSGEITSKNALLSSLISTQPFIDQTNINFNPQCEGISLSNWYFAPSLAIARGDVSRVLSGQDVKGEVVVNPYSYDSANILVGNTKNPERIFIAHYDAFFQGATDNASGVAVLMALLQNEQNRACNLYVLAGNEELSYDYPVYWGHGFRVLEEEHFALLNSAQEVVVVDCVGNDLPVISRDPVVLKLAFPIKNLDRWIDKITTVYGSLDKLFTVYHSNRDTLETVDSVLLQKTEQLLRQL